MKNFLKILSIALAVFFGIIYVEEGMNPLSHLIGFFKKTPIEGIQQPLPEIANELKEIIIKYNNSLVEAYERGDGNLVQNMEKGFKQYTVNEVFFTRQNLPGFQSKLNDIKFFKMWVSGDIYTVGTREDWKILFTDPRTKEERIREEIYRVRYDIKKVENKWRIINFDSKKEKEGNK